MPKAVLTDHEGPVAVEAWTVMHDRTNQPERFLGSCLTPAGERVWVAGDDPELMRTAMTDDIAGTAAVAGPGGTIELDTAP